MPPTSPSCAVSRILQDRQGCVIQAREHRVMGEVSGTGLGWGGGASGSTSLHLQGGRGPAGSRSPPPGPFAL